MKKTKDLRGAQVLGKKEQKSIVGGSGGRCHPSSDPECCGTQQGQCGTGPWGGGIFVGIQDGHILCDCF